MYLVHWVEILLDPTYVRFDPAIFGHFMAKNCPKKAKMALLGPQAGLAAPNWWISVDQGWIKLGYIRDNVLGPFPVSGMSIEGRHRAPKWPK